MNKTTSRRTITVAAIVVFAMASLASTKRDGSLPPMKVWVGYGLVFLGCSIADDLGTPIGAAMAMLVMVSSTIYYGEDALGLVAERTQGGGAATSKSGVRSTSGPSAITGVSPELAPPLSATPPGR